MVAMRFGTNTLSGQETESVTPAPVETETLLWTNPNTGTARSSLNATMSESLRNYEKIRVVYSYNTGSTNAPYFVIYPLFREDGTTYMYRDGTQQQRMNIGLNNQSGNAFVRQFYVSSDTVIHFENAYRVNSSGNTNTNLIPWEIYGIKTS